MPLVLLRYKQMQNIETERFLACLCDTGSTSSWINPRTIPSGAVTTTVSRITSSTMMGALTNDQAVSVTNITLPEFSRSTTIERLKFRVAPNSRSTGRYDAILGRDILRQLGLDCQFSEAALQWNDIKRPMTPTSRVRDAGNNSPLYRDLQLNLELDELEEQWDDDFITEIKPANYRKVDIKEVIDKCDHLRPYQKQQLENLLCKYTRLFDGTLKVYPHEKVHLDVDPQAKPVFRRAYPVPHLHRDVFKQELERLVSIGVLTKVGRSLWALPTFVVSKANGTVRWVSDFRSLNRVITRRMYPIPIISEVLERRKGYKFFSKLDVSMQYYTFELDDASKEYCTIATPFGLYRYNRLPMGVSQSPDVAQEHMEKTLHDLLEEIEVYIDDVGCFSDDWDKHLVLLDKVLQRLQDNGFTINPMKCEWGVRETDWLGYWLTPIGLKPWKKRVQPILDMKEPKDLGQLRSFIGHVNYYKNMWPRRAHILAPLTTMTGKKFEWKDEHQKAFERMKAVVAQDALLHYPDHNKPFVIESDASDYQLGAVILQDDKPVAYYSRKLNSAQQNYTTIEKEMLSIMETLKHFRTMLLGARILVKTDRKNLTYSLTQFQTQRVLRWRLTLQEFNPTIEFKAGKLNVVADSMSRVPTQSVSPWLGESPSGARVPYDDDDAGEEELATLPDTRLQWDDSLYDCFMALDDDMMIQSLADALGIDETLFISPVFDEDSRYPLDPATIAHYQEQDAALQAAVQRDPHLRRQVMPGDVTLIVHIDNVDEDEWRVVLPTTMLDRTIQWYHERLAHAGSRRTITTMARVWFNPQMYKRAEMLVGKCDACQKNKISSRAYGHLPPRDASLVPWEEIHVDLIGPWRFRFKERLLKLHALTILDPVTLLLEVAAIERATASHVADRVETEWLARYPRPMRCIHDQGGEFIGQAFAQMLRRNGIADVTTTARNPQSNALVERIHQVIANALRTTLQQPGLIENESDDKEIIRKCLAVAMFATRAATSTALREASPGAVSFHRDMLANIPYIADFLLLREQRQLKVDRALERANASRVSHDYQPGQEVLMRSVDPRKLHAEWKGPFRIEKIHTNGNVTLRVKPNQTTRLNIRQIKPYRRNA